jgi:hypothetical protein
LKKESNPFKLWINREKLWITADNCGENTLLSTNDAQNQVKAYPHLWGSISPQTHINFEPVERHVEKIETHFFVPNIPQPNVDKNPPWNQHMQMIASLITPTCGGFSSKIIFSPHFHRPY